MDGFSTEGSRGTGLEIEGEEADNHPRKLTYQCHRSVGATHQLLLARIVLCGPNGLSASDNKMGWGPEGWGENILVYKPVIFRPFGCVVRS